MMITKYPKHDGVHQYRKELSRVERRVDDAVRVQAAEPSLPMPRQRKDTNRWCRGKAGRLHDKVWTTDTNLGRMYQNINRLGGCSQVRKVYWVERCADCGKQFDYFLEDLTGEYRSARYAR